MRGGGGGEVENGVEGVEGVEGCCWRMRESVPGSFTNGEDCGEEREEGLGSAIRGKGRIRNGI